MQWGVRNGPPYPLSRAQMTSAERKEAKYRSKKINEEFKQAQNHKYRAAADMITLQNTKDQLAKKRADKLFKKRKYEKAKEVLDNRKVERDIWDEKHKNVIEIFNNGAKKVNYLIEKYKDEPLLEVVAKKQKSFGASTKDQLIKSLLVSDIVGTSMIVAGAPFIPSAAADLLSYAGLGRTETVDYYKTKVMKRDKSSAPVKRDSETTSEKIDKTRYLNNAKNNNKYDLTFLEFTQNYNPPKTVMLKEYEKYLDAMEKKDYASYREGMRKRLKKYEE